MSEDLVVLGIAPNNMAPNQPALDSGPLFVKAVNYAKAHQMSRVIADPGSYYMSPVSVGQLTNMTIDLQGSDLFFTQLTQGLGFYNSTNLVVQNFTADYQPLPFTQLQVVSVNATARQIQFTVPPGWRDPSAFNNIPTVNGWDGTLEVHIFRSGHPAPGTKRMATQRPFSGDRFTLINYGFQPGPSDFARIRAGDTAVLAIRYPATAVILVNCSGCTIRNVAAYSSPGDGVDSAYSYGVVMDHVYTMPRPGTDRLVSTYGLGFTPAGPNNTVRLNRAIRTLDDGISFDEWIAGIVQSQPSNRSLVVEGAYATTLSQGHTIPSGSAVAFERTSDGATIGSAVIVSQTAPSSSSQPYYVTFNFDRDLPSNLVGAAMYATDSGPRGSNTVMERNAVEEQTNCCRGVSIWGYVNSTLRGNYIHRSAMTGVHVIHVLNPLDWQSPPVVNLGISNNVIDQANASINAYPELQLGAIDVMAEQAQSRPMAVSPNQDINVMNNFIVDPGTSAVWIGNTTGGSVTGNYFLNPNSSSALISTVATQYQGILPGVGSLLAQPVAIETSVGISEYNNVIDQTSGRMWPTDTRYRELAAYAPGSVARLNAYNLGKLFNPSVTLTDADGKQASLIIQSTSTHALDVQLPGGAGLGGAYITLTSGGAKYFGTLFLDRQDNIPVVNGCTYETSPSSVSVPATASTVPILVITQAGCSYEALATESFVSAASSATGTSVISVMLADNAGVSRVSTIEIAGEQITLTQAALLPTIQAIVDSWNYTAGVAPGVWVTIVGTNLASGPPQTWNLNGTQQLPTKLSGESVTFNGTPAALYYVSPTQINALVPASVAPGQVQVVVQANGINSNPFTIIATATLPSVYMLPTADGSAFFVTAALAGTGTLIGNSAVDSRVTRAALPGDILDLYMIGLGATSDPSKFVTNQMFADAYPVSAVVTASIGGESAQVLFAGLTSPGLYLVRIAVPSNLPAGPQPIQITAGGAQTRPSLKIMVGAR